jgi:MerR family transcriptional regulator, copper efflux regulator
MPFLGRGQGTTRSKTALTFQLLEGLDCGCMNTYLTIGQVARVVGISAKTIRYYEDIKLLQPAKRMDNNYRQYAKEDIARLRLIKQARALGLPLDEVKQLVEKCLDGSCEHLKEGLLATLPMHIALVKERIKELEELQKQLEGLQKNLATLHPKDAHKKVAEKDCCEVLDQIDLKIGKGGKPNGSQKKNS